MKCYSIKVFRNSYIHFWMYAQTFIFATLSCMIKWGTNCSHVKKTSYFHRKGNDKERELNRKAKCHTDDSYRNLLISFFKFFVVIQSLTVLYQIVFIIVLPCNFHTISMQWLQVIVPFHNLKHSVGSIGWRTAVELIMTDHFQQENRRNEHLHSALSVTCRSSTFGMGQSSSPCGGQVAQHENKPELMAVLLWSQPCWRTLLDLGTSESLRTYWTKQEQCVIRE